MVTGEKWQLRLISTDAFLATNVKATCKRAQQLPTMLGVVSQQCCVRLHEGKSLTGFKLCATTSNNMQQDVQTDATCNIQQCWELLVNNVASVCTQPDARKFWSRKQNIKRAEHKREVERDSTLTSDHLCIASILFAKVNFTHVRTYKFRGTGNQPSED